jgi:tetratricopeptide (TPR) repeat protein
MDIFLGLLGFMGMGVGAIMLLYYAISKKSKKPAVIVLILSFVSFVVGVSIGASSVESDIADGQQSSQEQEDIIEETSLELSAQYFEEGLAYFDNGEYESAIKALERVIEENEENYRIAQELLSEARVLYSQELLERAKTLFNDGDYDSAIYAANLAVSMNNELKVDVDQLIEDAVAEQEKALLEQRRNEIIEQMKTYEGEGAARVAVSDVIAQSSFSDGFTTYRPSDPESTWFLIIGVGVANYSKSTIHVNPNFVTLICGNRIFNPDINTYSMNNYLDAINVQPGTYTAGWLLFLVPKANTYTLVYEDMWDKTVKKELVVTEIR